VVDETRALACARVALVDDREMGVASGPAMTPEALRSAAAAVAVVAETT